MSVQNNCLLSNFILKDVTTGKMHVVLYNNEGLKKKPFCSADARRDKLDFKPAISRLQRRLYEYGKE